MLTAVRMPLGSPASHLLFARLLDRPGFQGDFNMRHGRSTRQPESPFFCDGCGRLARVSSALLCFVVLTCSGAAWLSC